MATFHKTISDLEAANEYATKAAEEKKEAAAKLLEGANNDLSEADKASAIASKLRGLVEA